LDESHVLDLMLWCFGMPQAVFAQVERLSGLEIETDDNVDAWLAYEDGKRVTVHLDLYGRPHERSITVIGDEGTLAWSYEQNSLRLGRGADARWEETRYRCERNDMFRAAAEEFLAIIRGRRAPSCTIEDGAAVLTLIEALRRSAAAGTVVAMHEDAHA